jgi:hypothetical protein
MKLAPTSQETGDTPNAPPPPGATVMLLVPASRRANVFWCGVTS